MLQRSRKGTAYRSAEFVDCPVKQPRCSRAPRQLFIKSCEAFFQETRVDVKDRGLRLVHCMPCPCQEDIISLRWSLSPHGCLSPSRSCTQQQTNTKKLRTQKPSQKPRYLDANHFRVFREGGVAISPLARTDRCCRASCTSAT